MFTEQDAGSETTKVFKKFISNAGGATAIEYALIGGLLSILIVVGATAIGTSINHRFYNSLATALS